MTVSDGRVSLSHELALTPLEDFMYSFVFCIQLHYWMHLLHLELLHRNGMKMRVCSIVHALEML